MDARERLITSTQALLWERGYVGTSPKAIQQRAGVGQGSMYHHFSGKPDLALAAIERCAEQIRAYTEQRLSAPGTAFERIEAFLLQERLVLQGCQLGRLTADPEIVTNPVLHRPVAATFAWQQQRLAEVLREGQVNGEFAATFDADDMAATIAGVVQGGYVLAKAVGTDDPYYSAVRGLIRLLAAQLQQ
jgi:AcrR family transcriptional regulator